MKSLSRNLFLSLIVGLLAFAPVFVWADDNDDIDEKRQDKIEKRIEKLAEKQERKIEKLQEKLEKKQLKTEKKMENKINKFDSKCWSLFFRRALPFAWIRNHWDSIDLDQCFFSLPNAPKATTTDTIAPIISSIKTKTGHTRALVVWNTNEKASSKVYYSTTSPATTNSPSISINGQKLTGKEHYVLIQGLASSTTYYFLIEAKDKAGNTAFSDQSSFTTKSNTTPPDITAPIMSNINAIVGTSTIAVNWNTSESATSKVYYSATTPINTLLANFTLSGAFVTSHNLKLETLATDTLYYLMIESLDTASNIATSSQFSTTTLP